MTVIDVTTDRGVPEFGPPEGLPVQDFLTFPFFRSYDILPDGQRFVVVMPEEAGDGGPRSSRINVCQNWTEELKELVPVP